ncbi:MAG: hypothetical protein ACR5LG_01270 [Sodalis sp. (in: enterobacteria)]|uniref:hypothetical protein n=1 Tax=Sodalis sp. (in: enterobacteria) TaxID=1898979 RepID=UPI003F3B1C8A
MGHTTRYQVCTGDKRVKQQKLGWPPNGTLAYHDKGAWQPLGKSADGRYVLALQSNKSDTLTLTLGEQEGKPALRIGEQTVALTEGEWSPWCSLRTLNVSGSVRFYLGCYRPLDDKIEILQSQVTNPDVLCGQSEQARALLDQAGPFFSKWVVKASPQED